MLKTTVIELKQNADMYYSCANSMLEMWLDYSKKLGYWSKEATAFLSKAHAQRECLQALAEMFDTLSFRESDDFEELYLYVMSLQDKLIGIECDYMKR